MPSATKVWLLSALVAALIRASPSLASITSSAPAVRSEPPAPAPAARRATFTRFDPAHVAVAAQAAAAPTRPEDVPPPPASGAPLPSWNLDQLVTLALAQNPVLIRARARIDEARGAALQAGLWPNPVWDTNNPQILGLGSANAYNAGFQTEVPAMGKKRLDRQAAQQLITEAVFAARSDRYDVLQAVRQSFYSALAQQRRVEVLNKIVQIARGAKEAATRLYRAGLVAETDVLLLDVEQQRAESELTQAQTLLLGRKRRLAAAVARPDLPIGALVGDLLAPVPHFDDRFVAEYVATQNVDVLSAQAEVLRTNLLLRRARVEPVPNLYSGPAVQWGPLSQNNQFWYNFAFNITLWDRNQGNIYAARANIVDASANVRAVRNQLLRQAADALGRHRAAVQLAERTRRFVLPTAERNQQLVNEGYQKGLLPLSQLYQAQRSLFEANLGYVDALENVWTTAAELANLLQLERFP